MRHLDGLITLSRRAVSSALALAAERGESLHAVDATVGNGHDTLFLARNVGKDGRVWGFDIQEAALSSARQRFTAEGPDLLPRVCFCHAGHEKAAEFLPPEAHIQAALFNLGYLPGADKSLTTRPTTTLASLAILAAKLAPGGILSVHAYQGHTGGTEEGAVVANWFAGLPWEKWRVAVYAIANKPRNPETLFLAERF